MSVRHKVVKYSLLSFPLASFGLGVWQIKRLGWKKELIASFEKRLKEEPIDLLSINSLKDIDGLEYRRIRAKGRFDQDTEHQLYLKPRQLIVNRETELRGRTAHQQNIGVNVITPFQVDETNLRILVNRGWLATKGKDNVQDCKSLGLGKEDETIEIVGMLRKTDDRPKYGQKNDETSNEWQIRDVEAMSKVLKTAPILIDLDFDPNRKEGPIGGQTQLNIRNEHLNYAITWFSLSVFAYFMWYTKYGKSSKEFKKFR